MWIVERWDTNPKNVTFHTWTYVSSFRNEAEAKAYVKRAEGPTQTLAYRYEEGRGGRPAAS